MYMIVHRYDPDALTKKTFIPLGRACECRATRIEFDVSAWRARFPGGSIVLYIKTPNEVLYLADVTEADGVASWVLMESDTSTPGFGSLELALIGANGEKKLSAVAGTRLDGSLIEPGETPDYAAPWLERAAEHQAHTETAAHNAAIHAAQAVKAAENAAASASGSEASAEAAASSAETAAARAKAAAQSEENAAESENEAAHFADRAEMAAAASGWLDMEVNTEGHLIYTRSENVDTIDFNMQDGRLIVNYG